MNFQLELPFQDKMWIIPTREDGYMNLTAICKLAGKKVGHYLENVSTKEFINALSEVIGMTMTSLVEIIRGEGVPNNLQGTWAHEQVAMHCAYWCSPRFAIEVNQFYLNFHKAKAEGRVKVFKKENRRLTCILEEKERDCVESQQQVTSRDLALVEKQNQITAKDIVIQCRDTQIQALQSVLSLSKTHNITFTPEDKKQLLFLNNTQLMIESDGLVPIVQIAIDAGHSAMFKEGVAARLGCYVSRKYDSTIHGNRVKKVGGARDLQKDIWYYERHNDVLKSLVNKWCTRPIDHC